MNESSGWQAIDNALTNLYKEKEFQHFSSENPHNLGGDEYLEGISIYTHNDHFHYITYGLTELHEKISENEEYSGWGFEFTFRLMKKENSTHLPLWPIKLLQSLAKEVYNKGLELDEYHTLSSGPINPDSNSNIEGILLVKDPELNEINTNFGKVMFLQIIGLTLDEYYDIIEKVIDRREFIRNYQALNPLLFTDMDRE